MDLEAEPPGIKLCWVRTSSGTYHKPLNTIRHPKDPTATEKTKCTVVYKIYRKDCEKGDIGETTKPFGIRLSRLEYNMIKRV